MKKQLASIIACFPLLVQSATYHVDYVGGSDSNNGTSTSTPFQRCPGDPNATGTAASTSLSAGDTVIFKGGVSYQGRIVPAASGTSGDDIVYDGNSAGTWGTGKAIVDLGFTNYHFIDISTARDYLHIRNFNIHSGRNPNNSVNQTITIWDEATGSVTNYTGINFGGSGSANDAGYIYINGGDFIKITDCRFSKPEHWNWLSVTNAETDADAQTDANKPCEQIAINAASANSLFVSNCVLWAIPECIDYTGTATNLNIFDCNFGGDSDSSPLGWFSVALRPAGAISQVLMRGNTLHDGWQYQGDESTQRSHAGDWIHPFGTVDGVFGAGDANNHYYDSNLFYNTKVFTNHNGTATSLSEDDVWNITFTNNIFINPFTICIRSSESSNLVVRGNTFVHWGQPTVYLSTGTDGHAQDADIRDNIFLNYAASSTDYGVSSSSSYDFTKLPRFMDRNLYWSPDSSASRVIRWGTTNFALATWQSATGLDGNSVNSAPLFVDEPTELDSGPSDWDVSLQSGSPAKGAGTGGRDMGAVWNGSGGSSGASVPAIVAPGGPRPNRGGFW